MKNTTYLTSIINLGDTGRLIQSGMQGLGDDMDNLFANDQFIFSGVDPISLNIGEFIIESRLKAQVLGVDFKGKDKGRAELEGDFIKGKYKSRFAQRYGCGIGYFDILIPEEDKLFMIQELDDNRVFIQWSDNNHDREKQKVLQNSRYALFATVEGMSFPHVSYPLPLFALTNGQDVFMMGDAIVGVTGHIRLL